MSLVAPAPVPSDAAAAARAAGVVVRPPESQHEVRAISAAMARIWEVPEERSPGPPNVLAALLDTGGYVVGAWREGEVIGASFGLLYLDQERPSLRSQVTGTVRRRAGVGMAMKLHQREWAHERGLERITWTFDPLVRRNAQFNLARLGARVVRYVPDFYGSLDDGVNGSWPTDRCVVSWTTSGPLARPVAQAEALPRALDVDASGAPLVAPASLGATSRTIATPDDIVDLRADRPDLAHRWSVAVHDAMTRALDDGLQGIDVTADGRYVFAPIGSGGVLDG